MQGPHKPVKTDSVLTEFALDSVGMAGPHKSGKADSVLTNSAPVRWSVVRAYTIQPRGPGRSLSVDPGLRIGHGPARYDREE